uniref:Movement protein TGBp3 n=1 Tax=Hibiscus chlorotic speck associated virus 3 TaxID=3143944 RepID=A0AAU7L1Y8_9VIRU
MFLRDIIIITLISIFTYLLIVGISRINFEGCTIILTGESFRLINCDSTSNLAEIVSNLRVSDVLKGDGNFPIKDG